NVDGLSIVPPEVPKQIAGDRVTGSPAQKSQKSTLDLETSWVSPSGFDFDWRSGSVDEGYLDDLVPEDESKGSYLAKKARAATAEEGEGRGERGCSANEDGGKQVREKE